jgi:hypothetical protein
MADCLLLMVAALEARVALNGSAVPCLVLHWQERLDRIEADMTVA